MDIIKYIRQDIGTKTFNQVQIGEYEIIKKRRIRAKIREGDPEKDAIGLALSGGGIRSATFNLGILQALEKYGFLKWIDYLSTVSGGGYIGSSLSWFLSKKHGEFPFSKTNSEYKHNKPLQWLRRHSSYLCPGEGLDIWALIAAFLRGIFINLLIIIPIFFAITYFFSWYFLPEPSEDLSWVKFLIFSNWTRGDFFLVFLWLGIIILTILFFLFFLYAIFSRKKTHRFKKLRKSSVYYGWILKMGTILILVGLLPLISSELSETLLKKWQTEIISTFSLAGLISIITGWIKLKDKDETRGIRAFLLRIGLTLVIFVLLLVSYRLSIQLHNVSYIHIWGLLIPPYIIILISIIISIGIGLLSDINHVSMHRYYRNRLLETYMPDFNKDNVDFSESDKFFLHKMRIDESGAPYHIINSNLNTMGSKNPTLRLRGGENFIFTPNYVGSKATGYRRSEDYINGEMSLATAFSISGAAVDPNTGITRSRPLAFIMTLLNVRLGYWLINPKHHFIGGSKAPPLWHTYAFKEMLGWGMNEENSYVHVADGGHFENLGLYELVRRKCPYIIISDASADPDWTFKDLARVCELVRADFSSEVNIDTRPMHPHKKTHYSDQVYVKGEINYLNEETKEYDKSSKVIYIKTGVTYEGLPEDIHGYKRAHKDFPDESTANQFFDETQFEAYRELGYKFGKMIFENWEPEKPEDIFT